MNLLYCILGITIYNLIMPILESIATTIITWFTLKQNEMAVTNARYTVEREKIENEINNEETNCIGFVAPVCDDEEEESE